MHDLIFTLYTSHVPQYCDHGGLPFPSPLLLGGLNPKISPTKPPGFGTGHSLFGIALLDNAAALSLPLSSISRLLLVDSLCSPSFVAHFLRRRFRCGVPSGISPSAYANRGAGHGSTCGRATTKKLANSVVAKREDVSRLRGWR